MELLPITAKFFRPFAPLPVAGGHVIVTYGGARGKEARISAASTDTFGDLAKAASAALGFDVNDIRMVARTSRDWDLAVPNHLKTLLAHTLIMNSASRAHGACLALASMHQFSTPDPAPATAPTPFQMTSLHSARRSPCSSSSRR